MKIEYEATFLDVNKNDITAKLLELGATCENKEYLQRRVTLDLPITKNNSNTW